ncbi:MAG: hypothetical protein Q7J24_15080 [Desulfomicrobium sp.]|nr:hypothetical protein [Desulfomicrobium sp.]
MRSIRVLTTIILLLLAFDSMQNVFAQTTKEPHYLDLSKTLGFMMGQRLSLNRIMNEYPELSLRAQRADLEFQSAFGIAEKNIEKILKNILKDKYTEYFQAMEKQVKSTLMSQQISQDTATQFLDEVESRAKGEIPPPMLGILLNYQYQQSPVDELKRGFKIKYRTKGHPKATGLDVQIECAKSWSLREGNRPNVIQFFSSNNGNGPVFASIMTKDLSQEFQSELTHEEIAVIATLEGSKELASILFSDSSLKEILNSMKMTNVRNMTSKSIVLDGYPGTMLEFIGDQQRLDSAITMYNRMYIAIYKSYMIFLQFQVGKFPNDTENTLSDRIAKYHPLFHFMANSLVIQSQY